MSIRIKCGKTYGLMDDNMSIHGLMDYIVTNCVRPGTEYFYLSFNHECIAEYRKGVVYTLSSKQNVHDIPGYWKGDFYVCFKSRFPKKDEKKVEPPMTHSEEIEEWRHERFSEGTQETSQEG